MEMKHKMYMNLISVVKCGLRISNGVQDCIDFTEHMKKNKKVF